MAVAPAAEAPDEQEDGMAPFAVDDDAAHSCGGFVSAMQRTISMENCTEKSGDGLLSARHHYNTHHQNKWPEELCMPEQIQVNLLSSPGARMLFDERCSASEILSECEG